MANYLNPNTRTELVKIEGELRSIQNRISALAEYEEETFFEQTRGWQESIHGEESRATIDSIERSLDFVSAMLLDFFEV